MIEELLGQIEEIENSSGRKGLEFLIGCASHADPEVRFRSLERMTEFMRGNEQLREIVRTTTQKYMHDDDELVRCAVLEFFEDFGGVDRVEDVRLMLCDASPLVRGQAALTLASVSDVASIARIELALGLADDVCKAPMLAALVSLGVSSARSELLGLLQADSYQARCAVANLLSVSSNEVDNKVAVAALRQALSGEVSGAAISSMKEALSRLTVAQ